MRSAHLGREDTTTASAVVAIVVAWWQKKIGLSGGTLPPTQPTLPPIHLNHSQGLETQDIAFHLTYQHGNNPQFLEFVDASFS